MQTIIDNLHKQFAGEIAAAHTSKDVEALKVKYLGRKGPIQDLMRMLKDASPEQRPHLGKVVNDLRESFVVQLEGKEASFQQKEGAEQLLRETIDVTLPGQPSFAGRSHVISQAMDEMLTILSEMGFTIQYGPEIESEYYNFESLNFAPDHPARDMQDTFFIDDNTVLRTHTTNVQSRVLEGHNPPIRGASPGKAYRNETISARSHVFFHQIDVFYVDQNVSFADLQATMREFLKKLFKTDVETRFRPSYFPFVEPGMEVDVRCLNCGGVGCGLCKGTGWLEVAGAGMIHPKVLENAGIDPEKYTGFAWGQGVERLVMLKYGIKDIRQFTQNDLRFLEQFSAV
jgi:phenylalanyl-tRNA synthetase alpha chain